MSTHEQPDLEAMPVTTTRDREELRRQLESWAAARLPEDADARIPSIDSPGATGWSSETLLFDLAHTGAGERTTERLVARVAPGPGGDAGVPRTTTCPPRPVSCRRRPP